MHVEWWRTSSHMVVFPCRGLFRNFILPQSSFYNAGLLFIMHREALFIPRGCSKARFIKSLLIEDWLMRMVFIGVIHHACFRQRAGTKRMGRYLLSLPWSLLISWLLQLLPFLLAMMVCCGHRLIQTQKAFWGKVHELTCPPTHTTYSFTALETITTISGPWHLQVRSSMGMTELTCKNGKAYDYDCFYIILQFLFLTSRAKCSSHETIAVTSQWVLSKSSCLWYVYPMLQSKTARPPWRLDNDIYVSQVSEAEDEQVPLPCFTHDGISYLYLKHSNLYCT